MPTDALAEIPGLEVKACPSSGATEAYIVWALTAKLLHQLVQRGLIPHVHMGGNLGGATELNARAKEEFEKTGVRTRYNPVIHRLLHILAKIVQKGTLRPGIIGAGAMVVQHAEAASQSRV